MVTSAWELRQEITPIQCSALLRSTQSQKNLLFFLLLFCQTYYSDSPSRVSMFLLRALPSVCMLEDFGHLKPQSREQDKDSIRCIRRKNVFYILHSYYKMYPKIQDKLPSVHLCTSSPAFTPRQLTASKSNYLRHLGYSIYWLSTCSKYDFLHFSHVG